MSSLSATLSLVKHIGGRLRRMDPRVEDKPRSDFACTILRLAAALAIAVAVMLAGYAEVAAKNERAHIVWSFVVIGCNRVNGADVSPDNPSTANLPQLERSFTEIAKLRPRPEIVFVTGDMVFGLNSDLGVLRNQLESWLDVYRSTPLGADSKIRLIPLPGNHESLIGSKGSQKSNPGAEDVWLSVVAPFIEGSNGPSIGGPDNLASE